MSNPNQLRQEIQFTEEYHWVLEAMKQVAATELKAMERQRVEMGELKKELLSGFSILKTAHSDTRLLAGTEAPAAAIMLTSDAGFVGDLNIRIVRAALKQCQFPGEMMYVIGDQGERILKEQDCQYLGGAALNDARGSIEKIRAMLDPLLKAYQSGEAGRIILVYPAYRSMGRQDVTVQTLLPVSLPPREEEFGVSRQTVLESPVALLEQELARYWMEADVTQALWHVKMSELAARVVHLEGALDELGRQKKEAVLLYFRAVHEEMDRGIREVYASRLKRAA